jgi:serine/threonine-protein kinase RsbW/stage II sporulation protein AB (anti-sigma F factor)
VLHAYGDHETRAGKLEVEAAPRDGLLRLTVRDWGRGLVPRVESSGLGLGLPLIASVAASVEVRSVAGTGPTEIIMTFPYGSPEPDE